VTRARMDSVELKPFRAAVEAGIGGIMTAHITVPSLNGGNGDPATLSPAIMDGLLRREMGFRGLLFTDAMDMGAIDRGWGRDEAAVRAVEAGADVLLMPPSPEAAVDAVVAAVCDGRIPEERIDASVRRILAVKESLGLNKRRTVPLERLPEVVGIPAHEEVASRIARESITVLRNGNNLLPLLGTRSARVISVSYHRNNDLLAGRYFDAGLRRRYPRLDQVSVGRDSDPDIYDAVLRRARRANLVVVSLYVTARSYAGTVAVPEEVSAFIEELAARGIPHVVISFGNPYLITEFPSVANYMLAWSGSPVSQRAAVDALFGEIPVGGRIPTAIPGFFEIGSGLRIPARER
jgi:beta-N-acetylhexosaminidase